MNATQCFAIRIERTRHEFERVASEISEWLNTPEPYETQGQHDTQRTAIADDLIGAITELKTQLRSIELNDATLLGDVYRTCRTFDEAVVLLAELRDFYFVKFDQRRHTGNLGHVLQAADELVWSCYHGVMDRVGGQHRHHVAPLAYMSLSYSPSALESDKPLHNALSGKPGASLGRFLDNPAAPLLSLPPWCINDPWWLVFIAHEVGHHVQQDLRLVGIFREGIQATVQALEPSAADRWGRWSREIFADLLSVLLVGPAALRGLVEIEWTAPAFMSNPRTAYPSPVVRLELMAHTAELLGMDLDGVFPFGHPCELGRDNGLLRSERALIGPVVDFALQPLPGGIGTLPSICGFDDKDSVIRWFGPRGEAAQSAENLTAEHPLHPDKELYNARKTASGSLLAWSKTVATLTDERERKAAFDLLRKHTVEFLRTGAPPGRRAGTLVEPANGTGLARGLMDAARQRME